jgi:hypothetical protein
MPGPVQKLLTGIDRFGGIPGYSVDDWNSAVVSMFGPYVRRRSVLRRRRELLRSELINLAKIQAAPNGPALLSTLVRAYRRAIYVDRDASLGFLVDHFVDMGRSDQNWITLAVTHEPLSCAYGLTERAAQKFAILDTVLEGCYKQHAVIAVGFGEWKRGKSIPADIGTRDFGNVLSLLVPAYGRCAERLVRDPFYGIEFNQWRNVAAHKSFRVVTRSTIELVYGRRRQVKRITYAALERVLRSAVEALSIVRMASTLVYIEFMPDLCAIGLPRPTIALESQMVGLCHNLFVVGFKCLHYGGEGKSFVLELEDRLDREPLESVIHASQILDQIGVALEFDPTRSSRYTTVAIRVLDQTGVYAGGASISLDDVLAAAKGALSQKERLARTTFDFADRIRLRRALEMSRRGFSV